MMQRSIPHSPRQLCNPTLMLISGAYCPEGARRLEMLKFIILRGGIKVAYCAVTSYPLFAGDKLRSP
jgi:hypothetical protein